MNKDLTHRFFELTKLFSMPHPWHGINIGEQSPDVVKAFIEIVPGDTMKYELDKESGYLNVDRPQRYSNICPYPYGFVPQTLCADAIGEYCKEKTERSSIEGDNDPLDICVITERDIPHGNIILDAIPVGGFRLIDGDEADDKIISVMKGDASFGSYKDISDVPEHIIARLYHYFLTYKEDPFNEDGKECEITDIYGKEEAAEVIDRSRQDYDNRFGSAKEEFFSLIGEGLAQLS